jgi:beta-N-acetylhexosaminidase
MAKDQIFDAGRLIMAGLPGPTLDESTIKLIQDLKICNFILFRRNIQTPLQLKRLCRDLAAVCNKFRLPAPLIAIDQEGGSVARLPPPFSQFADARLISQTDNPEESARNFARTCARELCSVGITMNLAPVLDVCPVGQGCVMERRCLSENPAEVATLGAIIINEMQNNGVAACAKHFPGLGHVTKDPHQDMPLVNKKSEDLFKEDLIPFKRAMLAEVAAIMTSHTMYLGLDPRHPATLSSAILTGLLREKLAYRGLIITDDLEMGAIENNQPVATAALEAFMAGADLLLICQEQAKVTEACRRLQEAYCSGMFSEQRIAASLSRIDAVRNRFACFGRNTHLRQDKEQKGFFRQCADSSG